MTEQQPPTGQQPAPQPGQQQSPQQPQQQGVAQQPAQHRVTSSSRYLSSELVGYVCALILTVIIIKLTGIGPAISFQAQQDPTRIIYTISFLFVGSSVWILGELISLIIQNRAVDLLQYRLGNFNQFQMTGSEARTMFGQVLVGLRETWQRNRVSTIDYLEEIRDVSNMRDIRHGTIRFIARMSQYLGVIGTMLGLIMALGVLYQELSVESEDLQAQIIEAIKKSMSGMYAAYGTSVAGLFMGSILLTLGAMLIRNAMDKLEIRMSMVIRHYVMPQINPMKLSAENDENVTRILVKSLDDAGRQMQNLSQNLTQVGGLLAAKNAEGEALKPAVESVHKELSILRQWIEHVSPSLEKSARLAQRVMGDKDNDPV